MRPAATHITLREGGDWIPFCPYAPGEKSVLATGCAVHAIKFEDGSIWDCFNGWRDTEKSLHWDTARYNLWDLETKTTHPIYGTKKAIDYVEKLISRMEQSGASHPGTPSPPSLTTAPSSESASSKATTSSEVPEDILLEAVRTLQRLPDSYEWSLIMASGPSNCTFEVNRPSAATASPPGFTKGQFDKILQGTGR